MRRPALPSRLSSPSAPSLAALVVRLLTPLSSLYPPPPPRGTTRTDVLALCDKFAPRAARTARHARNDSRTTVAFTSAADAAAALAAVRSFCARTGEEVDGRFVGDAVKKSAKKEPADDGRQGEQ